MKILFTQDTLGNAGAERSHLEIISRFSEEMNVGFVYFYPKHDLKAEYEGAGIRLFFLDIPESYHFPLAVFRLIKLIRKEKPDLLISSLWRADMITRTASLITGVPLVGTLVNDSYSPMAWKDKKGFKYKFVYWLDRMTSGIPIHWIANAKALADSHVKTLGLDRDRISIVYRGRPVPMPRSVSPQTGTICNFISYGRLLERKGFQDAIRAFAQVLPSYPDITLTIFGKGPFRKNLENLIQVLGLQGSVFLPGKISNPSDLLISDQIEHRTLVLTEAEVSDIGHPTSFNCFLFPSWYEGFSGALVEAMMAGIPIIASDIPMNLEAVKDRETALVFPVRDAMALADQIFFAIKNPEKMIELGQKAREVAIQNFDIEVIAKEYEGVLRRVTPASTHG